MRRTLSDVNLAQEAMIERLAGLVETCLAAMAEQRAQRPASETVKIARGGTGDHATGLAFEVVVQDDETLEDAVARAGAAFERAAARYPLPSGYAHPWQLDGAISEGPQTLREQLSESVANASRKAPAK